MTKLAQSGIPAATVMKLVGHANLNTTMRYYHVEMEYKAQAMAIIENYL
ncbi:MAG: site-specific integrase [Clostridiales Family XIII bacterium]|nr:site-specific integrase [Clostridiales Family XIII bacterium]